MDFNNFQSYSKTSIFLFHTSRQKGLLSTGVFDDVHLLRKMTSCRTGDLYVVLFWNLIQGPIKAEAFLSNLSQGPIKVSLFQGQSFSQLDIYVVNHFLVIDVIFTKIPITHKMLHIVVEPFNKDFRRLRNSHSTTVILVLHNLEIS